MTTNKTPCWKFYFEQIYKTSDEQNVKIICEDPYLNKEPQFA